MCFHDVLISNVTEGGYMGVMFAGELGMRLYTGYSPFVKRESG